MLATSFPAPSFNSLSVFPPECIYPLHHILFFETPPIESNGRAPSSSSSGKLPEFYLLFSYN
jgi:hypothetical protein